MLERLEEYNLQDYFNYDEESDSFFVYSDNGEKVFVIDKTNAINSFDKTDINIAEKFLDIDQVFTSDRAGDLQENKNTFIYVLI